MYFAPEIVLNKPSILGEARLHARTVEGQSIICIKGRSLLGDHDMVDDFIVIQLSGTHRTGI